MKRSTFYNAIFRAIERVYLAVSLSLLHKRMNDYHAQACRSFKPFANDIKKPLLLCIHALAESATGNNAPALNEGNANQASDSNKHVPAKYNVPELHVLNKNNVGELSKYFRLRNSESIVDNGIEKKLEHSTWEHIHAVVRYARQGNNSHATLHANIANTACKELAHFMLEDQYRIFVMEIEQYLTALKIR